MAEKDFRKELEKGWQEFRVGTRVKVRIEKDIWKNGVVMETAGQNGRSIIVKCSEKVHDKEDFFGGCGICVPVFQNTRSEILANIRKIRVGFRCNHDERED